MHTLRWLALTSFLTGLSMLVAGFFFGGDDEPNAQQPLDSFDLRDRPGTTANAEAPATATVTAVPAAPPDEGGVSRMRLPALEVDYPIENIGLIPGTNQLDTPQDELGAIGWYDIWLDEGRKPGFGKNSVFSAHVNYEGKEGPFANLSKTKQLDEIVVVMESGREYRYEVIAKQGYVIDATYATAERPVIEMGRLISAQEKPPGEEWVTLITCSCGPGRIVNVDENGFGDCVDRDVVIGRRKL